MTTINFTRLTFSERVASDILALRPSASRFDIAETAQRFLQDEYRKFTPDPGRDHIANVVAFLRRHPAASRLALAGPPIEADALPNVTVAEPA
jgi:hypothetical protein